MIRLLKTIEFHPYVRLVGWTHWGFEYSLPVSSCDCESWLMLHFGRWGCGVSWIPKSAVLAFQSEWDEKRKRMHETWKRFHPVK